MEHLRVYQLSSDKLWRFWVYKIIRAFQMNHYFWLLRALGFIFGEEMQVQLNHQVLSRATFLDCIKPLNWDTAYTGYNWRHKEQTSVLDLINNIWEAPALWLLPKISANNDYKVPERQEQELIGDSSQAMYRHYLSIYILLEEGLWTSVLSIKWVQSAGCFPLFTIKERVKATASTHLKFWHILNWYHARKSSKRALW